MPSTLEILAALALWALWTALAFAAGAYSAAVLS